MLKTIPLGNVILTLWNTTGLLNLIRKKYGMISDLKVYNKTTRIKNKYAAKLGVFQVMGFFINLISFSNIVQCFGQPLWPSKCGFKSCREVESLPELTQEKAWYTSTPQSPTTPIGRGLMKTPRRGLKTSLCNVFREIKLFHNSRFMILVLQRSYFKNSISGSKNLQFIFKYKRKMFKKFIRESVKKV